MTFHHKRVVHLALKMLARDGFAAIWVLHLSAAGAKVSGCGKGTRPFFSGIGDNSRCAIRPFFAPPIGLLEISCIAVSVPDRSALAHFAFRTARLLRDLFRAANAAICRGCAVGPGARRLDRGAD
jgi:hypothetical protein